MKIQIRQRGVALTRGQRGEMERRLGLALGRFSDLIERVSVGFARGGLTKTAPETTCDIEVRLRPRSVRVSSADRDPVSAMDGASGRISRSLARAVEREHAWDETAGAPAFSKP
jgi:ribosome-associated translation inhibitor RaiA